MDLVNHLSDRLLFAIPKKGRLYAKTLSLLAGSDLSFHRDNRLDIALVKNLPIALVFLPAADIPRYVGEGNVDLGITGQDQILESEMNEKVEEVLGLGFGDCKLQVQVPENGVITAVEQLVGKRIVTSFGVLTKRFFENWDPNGSTAIKNASGSVEAACALGLADGIVDLVESGETMKAAGLKPIHTLLTTTAVLIASKHPRFADLQKTIISRIRGVIVAKQYCLVTYNIERSILSQATAITPGKRAPSIISLDAPGWVAVQAMVLKKECAKKMDELEIVGAVDILVVGIDNSRA
ncbi:ATP phosphoribosyltransferase [Neolecta irregularis DAH-3]|uniref:ATP phosphoribosyltransferase n=1 Tax=Neolecta irregularis (strain DAH-3) TaxID=1198029 RepID=A0A1U7LPL4_NEOID|nr:ATP phosphoribosyltransferase [Neolecta irregularis DAH-3]|eukprot:OLL24606.1 ATP phosphoribosyltransferase [Neolecta irregularis DAH-3]